MKGIGYILMGLCVAILLSCCTRTNITLLQQAERFLPQHPDSAQACLDSIPRPDRLGDADRAFYGLLRTYVADRQGKGVGSDSLIRESYEYYRDASNVGATSDMTLLRHYAQSCYYMSNYYSSCDSTKQCEDLLRQAIKSSRKCEDWHTCYLAHIQLGIVILWSNPEYAVEQGLEALSVYHKINDNVNNEVLILGQIGGFYLAYSEFDKALEYFLNAHELAEKNHLLISQKDMCKGIASAYLYMGEHTKEALMYAKMGLQQGDSVPAVASQITLAQCYTACDSLNEAKDILYSITDTPNPMQRYFIYRCLSDIAIQTHEFDSLSVYADSVYACMEDRFLQSQAVKDEYYQENISKELQKEKIQHEATLHRWILGAIILFLVIFSLFIYHVARNRIAIQRQKRMNNVLARRVEHSQHMEEQRRKESVIKEHQQEIRHQQEIIRQKAITLSVIQKHLMEKLDHVAQAMSESEKIRMTEDAWREIEYLINDTDDNFVQKLRQQHKDFKEEDIQLCMLTRLKMTNATIANIYFIGISAVKKRKLALKKLGFQITDPAISLEQVIENL